MTPRSPLGILCIGSGAGIASLLLLPLETLVPSTMPPLLLRSLALIQPALLVALALWVGARLGPRIGLGSPILTAHSLGQPVAPLLKARLPALVFATIAGSALLLIHAAIVTEPLRAINPALAAFEVPVLTRLLYGGIAEEIIVRWGLLTAIAFAVWRSAGRPDPLPDGIALVAIIAAAAIFAAGHLPILLAAGASPGAFIIGSVLIGNFLAGLLFGFLYCRHGIETAILAHGGCHVVATLIG